MLNEIILDFRMGFGFLYAAYQLSAHSQGIRLYEIQDQMTNYADRHRERIVSERNVL